MAATSGGTPTVSPDAGGKRWYGMRTARQATVNLTAELDTVRAMRAAAEELADGVVMVVEDQTCLSGLSRYNQADATMHTLEAWEKRFALRRTPEVRESLHAWWMTALRTVRNETAEGELPELRKASYVKIYKLLFRALAQAEGEEYDEDEAISCAEEDWQSDSRDGVTMPRELFMDSLFQIADLYTDEADARVYADFLSAILEASVLKGTVASDPVFWKPPPKPKHPKAKKTVIVAPAVEEPASPSPPVLEKECIEPANNPTEKAVVAPTKATSRTKAPPPTPKEKKEKKKSPPKKSPPKEC
jgi:hypothetical protein